MTDNTERESKGKQQGLPAERCKDTAGEGRNPSRRRSMRTLRLFCMQYKGMVKKEAFPLLAIYGESVYNGTTCSWIDAFSVSPVFLSFFWGIQYDNE